MFINTVFAATIEEIISKTISQVVQPFIAFLFVLATVVFIYGVVEFIYGAEDDKKREQGKQHIMWGILGLFIMTAAAGIMWVLARFWISM